MHFLILSSLYEVTNSHKIFGATSTSEKYYATSQVLTCGLWTCSRVQPMQLVLQNSPTEKIKGYTTKNMEPNH